MVVGLSVYQKTNYVHKARHVKLGHVNCQYRHITLLKHFGAWNTTKSLQPGQLSLFCVACPQPGINLKPDWKSDPETSECKYTANVVLDGNYSAQHLSSATPAQREVRLGHRTVKYVNHCAISQAESEHKSCDISGIVSTACGDHGAWFPLGTVNLQKGEK
ncbi:hypothetical protein OF83DRAFT_1071507, partial [Amylostereum chailletii]